MSLSSFHSPGNLIDTFKTDGYDCPDISIEALLSFLPLEADYILTGMLNFMANVRDFLD